MNKNYFLLVVCVFSLCVFNVEAAEKGEKRKKTQWRPVKVSVGKGLEIIYPPKDDSQKGDSQKGDSQKDGSCGKFSKIAVGAQCFSLTDTTSCGRKSSPTKDYDRKSADRAFNWIESRGHKGGRSVSVPVTQWGDEKDSNNRGAERRKAQSTVHKRED